MDPIPQPLLDEVDAWCSDSDYKRTVLRHCAGLDPSVGIDRFHAQIHPCDQMLTHSLREHGDASIALNQYFAIALQQYDSARQILATLFGDDAKRIQVLDFACGYGRLLRFLSLQLPTANIWAAELQSDALEFVSRAFGVQVLASHADPARFTPGRTFDFIWVASLFSHLPEALFSAWLAKLIALLSPCGVLCFSVRDAGLLPVPNALPASGFLYSGESENAGLNTEIYGTAFASEAFVRAALATAGGSDLPYFRLHRALANEQDLYVVAKDVQRDLSTLSTFQHGLWGCVDRRRLSRTGELYLEGWAGSLDDGIVETVKILIDGVSHTCTLGVLREDVRDAFDDERLLQSGWQFRMQLPSATPEVGIEVRACSARGATVVLYVGRLRTAN